MRLGQTLALLIALVFSLAGCAHGASHRQVTTPPSSYTPQEVRRAFARAGLPLNRDVQDEAAASTFGGDVKIRALFTGPGVISVTVYMPTDAPRIELVEQGQKLLVRRNVDVEYPKGSRWLPRIRHALSMLPHHDHL